ncbi:hypothetical protein D3C76_1121800 [compost metagenome]
MLVEPAMGEASGRHQVRHTHTVKASLAKQDRGRLDDVLSICLGLGLGHPHFSLPRAARKSCSHHT